MKETVIAKYIAIRDLTPAMLRYWGGTRGTLKVTAQAYLLGGNSHPHFSVTADIRVDGREAGGGCCHEEILKLFPKLKPIIDLHLSNADDGEPMHATANGFYQLAGSVEGNFGERYHAGNSERHFPITPPEGKAWLTTEYRFPTMEECVTSTAEYLRISEAQVRAIREEVIAAFKAGSDTVATSEVVSPAAEKARTKAGNAAAKARWSAFIDTLRAQWQAEAEAGLALIRELSNAPATVTA